MTRRKSSRRDSSNENRKTDRHIKKQIESATVTSETVTFTVVSPRYGTYRVTVDAEDWPKVSQHAWSVVKGKKAKAVYFAVNILRGQETPEIDYAARIS